MAEKKAPPESVVTQDGEVQVVQLGGVTLPEDKAFSNPLDEKRYLEQLALEQKVKAAEDARQTKQLEDYGYTGEFLIGLWGELPNYGCPQCEFASLNGDEVIRAHIAGNHPVLTPPAEPEEEVK